MIIVNRTNQHGESFDTGLLIKNIAEVNAKADEPGACWVKYWNGQEVRTMVVNHSLEQMQKKIFCTTHGKLPAKGVLEA